MKAAMLWRASRASSSVSSTSRLPQNSWVVEIASLFRVQPWGIRSLCSESILRDLRVQCHDEVLCKDRNEAYEPRLAVLPQ